MGASMLSFDTLGKVSGGRVSAVVIGKRAITVLGLPAAISRKTIRNPERSWQINLMYVIGWRPWRENSTGIAEFVLIHAYQKDSNQVFWGVREVKSVLVAELQQLIKKS